jgi:hypothetical protein
MANKQTATLLVIDPTVFTAAVSNAVQMLTDNSAILAYVFGIPLFLILVAVIMGWVKSIRRAR